MAQSGKHKMEDAKKEPKKQAAPKKQPAKDEKSKKYSILKIQNKLYNEKLSNIILFQKTQIWGHNSHKKNVVIM